MLVVPLQATPAQTVAANLAQQSCSIVVSQKGDAIYVDLYVNNALVIGGVVGRNLVRIVRDLYLGFSGDLLFVDKEGDTDPEYTGLGDAGRYALVYLEPADLPPGIG